MRKKVRKGSTANIQDSPFRRCGGIILLARLARNRANKFSSSPLPRVELVDNPDESICNEEKA